MDSSSPTTDAQPKRYVALQLFESFTGRLSCCSKEREEVVLASAFDAERAARVEAERRCEELVKLARDIIESETRYEIDEQRWLAILAALLRPQGEKHP